MKTIYILCELDVGDLTDIPCLPGYDTIEQAKQRLHEIESNPLFEVPLYIMKGTINEKGELVGELQEP